MNRSYFVMAVVLAVAGVLRWNGIERRSLWLDEAMSASFLDFPAQEILRRAAEPQGFHPPLYFLALKAWGTVMGDSELSLRSLSAALGLATILGVYGLVRGLGRASARPPNKAEFAACLAASLVALSPMQIHLGRIARGYTLVTALLMFGGWSLVSALWGSARWRPFFWLTSALLGVAACYTHNLALFTVAAQGVFALLVLAYRSRNRADDTQAEAPAWRGAATGAVLFIGMYLVPWIPKLLGQSHTIQVAQFIKWPITLENATDQVFQAIYGTFDVAKSPDPAAVWLGLEGLLFVWVGLAIRRGWDSAYGLITGILPLLLLAAFSLRSQRSIVHARYLCMAQLSWLVGLALFVSWLPARIRWIVAPLLLAGSAYACRDSWKEIGPSANPGIRAASQKILADRKEDEPVLIRTPVVFFGMKYYLRGRLLPRLGVTEPGRAAKFGSEHLRDEDLIQIDQFMGTHPPGCWVVSSKSYKDDLVVPFTPPIDWKREGDWSFAQDVFFESPVTVEHYRAKTAENPRHGETPHIDPAPRRSTRP